MRNYFTMLFFIIPVVAIAQSISLSWQYSSNSLAQGDSNGWPYNFIIRATNQLGLSWPVVYNQPASNTSVIGFDGTNYTYAVTNPTAPGQMFFVATVSNIWGESSFSNTSSVPPLPTLLHPKIFKN